jgi:hypothetical protein
LKKKKLLTEWAQRQQESEVRLQNLMPSNRQKKQNPGKVPYVVTLFKEKILKSPFFSGVGGGAD